MKAWMAAGVVIASTAWADRFDPGAGAITDRGDRQFFPWTLAGTTQVWRQGGPRTWPIQLTGGEESTAVAAVAPDGTWLVVSRGGGLAYITDDGKALYFGANDIDPASTAIYRWENGEKTLVFDRPGAWHVVDHRGDAWLMIETIGPGHVEVYEYAYGAKPGQILVRTSKLGEYQRLYALDGGTLTPITPALEHDVAGFRIDAVRARIYYAVNVDGYERLDVLDARTLKRIDLPALPQSENQQIRAVSRNGRFAPASLESFTTHDGTKVPMFVRRPASCGEPCPVVVLGGFGAGFDPYAQRYVDAGFVTVTPTVRGLPDVDHFRIHADSGNLRDLEDLAAYIRTAWAKDGRAPKIGVLGHGAALAAMTDLAGSFDAGVVDDALPGKAMPAVKAPLLLVEGARDPRAPVGEALRVPG